MTLESIRDVLVPRLKECRVVSVTLTGGEPFAHANIIEIVSLWQKRRHEGRHLHKRNLH
jgi:organic radical activating enzyme